MVGKKNIEAAGDVKKNILFSIFITRVVNFMMDFFTNIGLSAYASKGFSSFRITEMIQFFSSVRVCVRV